MGALEVQPGAVAKDPEKGSLEKTPRELMLRIRQALDSKEGGESLQNIGNLLYDTYKSKEYSPEIVLSSIREIYNENNAKFKPKISFNRFIQSFGPGMVMLCQEKLIAAGGYNLGKFGKNKDGVDGKLGKMTGKALRLYYKKVPRTGTVAAPIALPQQDPDVQLPPRQLPAPPQPVVSPEPPPVEAIVAPPLPHPFPAPPLVEIPGEPSNPMPVSAPIRPADYIPAAYNPAETPDYATPYVPPEPTGDVEVIPYTPGTESGTISPNSYLNPQLDAIYAQNKTTLNHQNLPEHYGRSEAEVRRFIIYDDPVAGGTVSFLGRTIDHKGRSGPGINMIALPFLKIAEAEIQKLNINYQPRNKIGGFAYRNMRLNGKMSDVKSHHAYGLAIDMDSDTNDSKDGRGDIPDEVVMALVKAGFAWGGTRNPAFSYLGRDAMHFQLRFDARDPEAQRILRASPIGMKYWNAILPLLPDEYRSGLDQGSSMVA